MINYKNRFKYNLIDTLEIIDNERYLYKDIDDILGLENHDD